MRFSARTDRRYSAHSAPHRPLVSRAADPQLGRLARGCTVVLLALLGLLAAVEPALAQRRRGRPAAARQAQKPVARQPQPAEEQAAAQRIGRIEITGNNRVEDQAIRARLKMRPGTPFDAEKVNADIRTIFAMGFFENVEADLSTDGEERVLTYRVVERAFVQEVRLEGNKKLDKEELEQALKIKPNTIFDPERARVGILEAKKLYDKKGYLDATIAYRLEKSEQGRTVLVYTIDEKEVVRIYDVEFEGNRNLDDGDLSGIMQTREQWIFSFLTGRGNLDHEVLKTDMERLTAYYYENGYIDVRVDEPKVERDDKGLRITIKIDEGEVYQFGEVSLAGEVLEKARERSGLLAARAGETFQPSKLREDINLLTDIYGDLGYAFVNVAPDTTVNPRERAVQVEYRISKGPEVTIDRIEITGNTKTRDKVIRRELELQEQVRFSGSKLRRSQEKLKRLGFFEDVNVTTRKADAEDRLDLLVDVKEASTGSFAAGAGISSGESFLFNVRLAEINLFGRGQRVVLNADFGAISRNISLSLTEPYFLDTELTAGIDAYNWEFEFDDFTRGGTGGALRFLYPFTALGLEEVWGLSLVDTRLGIEYRIENAEIGDVRSDSQLALERGSSITSSITPRLFRDTRNHPFDPTAGSLQDFSLEIAGVGGTNEFLKAESRGRWYIPVWKSPQIGTFTFSTGYTFGYGFGYGDKDDLPLFERYFPGGINSVRGYAPRSLGPRADVRSSFVTEQDEKCELDPDGGTSGCQDHIRDDVIGGSQQLIFNTEIIFPLVEQLGLKGVVFFDAGNAYSVAHGIDFAEMRTATGVGIRWLSPIGPLRIEVGFPLNAQVGDDTQRILFSFGGPP